MPILNYRTKVDSFKTAGEIQALLAKAGANSVMLQYDKQNRPVAVAFQIDIDNQAISFFMPCERDGVLAAMQNDPGVGNAYCTEDHAQRVAWRILKSWIEAQLARIEAHQAEVAEVFFAYAQRPDGQTLYQLTKQSGFSNLLEHKR